MKAIIIRWSLERRDLFGSWETTGGRKNSSLWKVINDFCSFFCLKTCLLNYRRISFTTAMYSYTKFSQIMAFIYSL